MSDFDNGWSVASVFNTNGTCHSAGIHSHSPAPTIDLPRAPVAFDNPRKNTESVADCIRKLGYTVQCGRGGEGWCGKYIILSISKKRFYLIRALNRNCYFRSLSFISFCKFLANS